LNSIGAIIVAAFAVLWVAAGASNMQRRWFTLSMVIAIAISGAIVFTATRIPFGRHSGGFNGKIYGVFVTLEFLAILIVAVLLNRSGRTEYLIPVTALIVGLHFFGMVPATHSNEFWWVGGAMCVLPLLTMVILPQPWWTPVVGFGCALILWLSGLGAFF
jgi:hypothetical protein